MSLILTGLEEYEKTRGKSQAQLPVNASDEESGSFADDASPHKKVADAAPAVAPPMRA